ncbi:MAG: diphthamide biosynthesis enzyme Dph2 [Candidatus Thermoplasmatota archaeon]
MIEEYDLELEKLINEIKKRGLKRVGIQLPSGMINKAKNIIEEIERCVDTEVIVSGKPLWGACDIDKNLIALGAELIFQFGHFPIRKLKTPIPIIYIPLRAKVDVDSIVEKIKKISKKGSIGLLTTPQFSYLPQILRKKIKKMKFYSCNVLGCDYSHLRKIEKRVLFFLYIGTGTFHPVGAALSTKKKVLAFDPYTNEIKDMEEMKKNFLRKRWAVIESSKSAERFGIILSIKQGQLRFELAKRIKKNLNENGKKAFIIATDEVLPEELSYFDVDAFVNTACPRIAIDDALRFKKPILTHIELEILLGIRDWKDWMIDEISSGSFTNSSSYLEHPI